MIPSLKAKLTRILTERGRVNEADLQRALAIQKDKGGSLSEILISLELVSKDELMIILSKELGIPPINLSRYKIDPKIIAMVPKKIAKHYKILPISVVGKNLTIAMADPLNVFAIDDMKTLTGFKINPVIATEKDIRDAFGMYYEEDATAAIEKIVENLDEAGEVSSLARSSGDDSSASPELLQMTQDAPVVKITNIILAEAVAMRSSDVLIEPMEHELRVRYRVDGILQEGRRPPKNLHAAIVSRLKVMSELDIAERRLPQDGRFKVKIRAREIDFRISVIPSNNGEKVALRILDKSQAMLDIDTLGMDKESVSQVKKDAARPHGMILICGPTGSGKTTTLYSILKHVDSPKKNLVTVEDPVEYMLEGINQVTARPDIGLTFANALRSILRQDPNIIMIGEIRDFETVDIAIKAALTGHLVLSTLHTTTATGSIIRLVNMGVEPFLITSSLMLVGAQRLVRMVCRNCKEPYEPNDAALKAMNIRPGSGKTVFFKGRGCEVCGMTGYKGRTGLFEFLPMTPRVKSLVAEGAQEYKIREEARREGMRTLRENGAAKVLEGTTTIDEILRVTVGDQDIEAGR